MTKIEINNILIRLSSKYNFKNILIGEIIDKYNESHRHYHTWDNHIVPMIESITEDYKSNNFLYVITTGWDGKMSDKDKELNDLIYDKLLLAAIFHDIIYDPKSKINEIMSVDFMLKLVSDDDIFNDVEDMILSTIDHEFDSKRFEDIADLFIGYDLEILTKSFADLLKWEKQIQKEYSFVNWSEYKKERIKILTNLKSKQIENININGIDSLIDIIESTTPNVGIYAGSFDPFHIGHMDILNKAENIFDKVIIAKGLNRKKDDNTYRWNSEFKKLKTLLPGNEVIQYQGLLIDVLKEQKDVNITLIRGLRNGYDLDAENTLTAFMKDMYPELNIVYISSNKDLEHISSSAIREIRTYDEKLVEKYLPIKK